MNISDIINRIELDVGIYGMALPIDNTEDFLATVIKKITLPVFSIVYPRKKTDTVRLSTLRVLNKTLEYIEYYFTGPNDSEIAFVEDVRPVDGSGGGPGWCYGAMYGSTGDMVQDIILSNASANLTSLMVQSPTHEFEAPNRLRLYNFYTDIVVITYGLMHTPSLSSIPFTASESFYKLAVLDCKSALYNMIKHYSSFDTAKGRVDLKIDDWADAPSKREELLSGWDDTYHLDRKAVYWK